MPKCSMESILRFLQMVVGWKGVCDARCRSLWGWGAPRRLALLPHMARSGGQLCRTPFRWVVLGFVGTLAVMAGPGVPEGSFGCPVGENMLRATWFDVRLAGCSLGGTCPLSPGVCISLGGPGLAATHPHWSGAERLTVGSPSSSGDAVLLSPPPWCRLPAVAALFTSLLFL